MTTESNEREASGRRKPNPQNKAAYDAFPPDLKAKWLDIQESLKKQLIVHKFDDNYEFIRQVRRVGGFDTTFVDHEDGTSTGFACLTIVDFPELKMIAQFVHEFHTTVPYLPGFLAFREVDAYVELYKRAWVKPDVCLVDGNGILHERGLGLASHLGVLLGVPTIGVTKSPHVTTIPKKYKYTNPPESCTTVRKSASPTNEFWSHYVHDDIERPYAAAWPSKKVQNPIYISVGHMMGLRCSIDIVAKCCMYRIPEPIRQSDIRSRLAAGKIKQTPRRPLNKVKSKSKKNKMIRRQMIRGFLKNIASFAAVLLLSLGLKYIRQNRWWWWSS